MTVFHYQKDSKGIVTLTMDMTGSVNTMNSEYDGAMSSALDKLETENDLTGVVLASAKKTFFAGGDLKELLAANSQPAEQLMARFQANKNLLRRLESLPVPVVAAINGAALGGGWELCLACHHRIAWHDSSVKLGLPEVTLGLLPGAGGIVRMIHLLGLEQALPYLLEGKKFSADQAQQMGLVHELVQRPEQLIEQAKQWILPHGPDNGRVQQPWDQKGHRIPGGGLSNPTVAQLAMLAPLMLYKKTRGLLPAPERILDTAIETLKLDFDSALTVETRNFVTLVKSEVAKNMISTFFFQLQQVNGGASRPQGIVASNVRKVGIIGAGMMGQSIAYSCAQAGIEVILKDLSLEAAEKGKAYSAMLMDKQIAKGRSGRDKKQRLLSHITATETSDLLKGCDLIIEAVFENVELKHRMTKECESRLATGGIWGSNTSTLPISLLANGSEKPEQFIGIHFFSPVDKMPLVELICGDKTSDDTLAKAFDFVRQIGKTPIVVNDKVGFYTSRTFCQQLMEAAQLVAEGVHPVRVDNLGKAIGMPVGPLTVHDEVSQQLTYQVTQSQINMGLKSAGENPMPLGTALIERMVTQLNRRGRHHGDGGYYDYGEQGKHIWPELIDIYYRKNVEICDQDIKDRLLFINVIESLKCLEEEVVCSVADANIGSIMGIGAPSWTGGYIQFVNGYGLQKFIDRCRQLAEKYGDRFKAPAIVAKTLASTGQFQ